MESIEPLSSNALPSLWLLISLYFARPHPPTPCLIFGNQFHYISLVICLLSLNIHSYHVYYARGSAFILDFVQHSTSRSLSVAHFQRSNSSIDGLWPDCEVLQYVLPLEPLDSCSISLRLDLYRQTSLISMPFNPAITSQFIEYYNNTIQYHTTLSYLKSPPPGYQQPATDILKGLQDIQNGIDRGLFPNQ